MASRHALGQSLQLLGRSIGSAATFGVPVQASRRISTSRLCLWPDVVVPPMGESIKEGSISAVLKQVGQPVREDETIAQVETDKVVIDVKAPKAGVVQQLLVKPSDTVVAGQLVAVVAEGVAVAAAPATPSIASQSSAGHTVASSSGRRPMIQFPPRLTATGSRISDLPEAEHATAVAASPPVIQSAPKEASPAPPAPAFVHPMPAAKAAPPPITKNKLQYITRPDGRGGPPRRPLSERELEMINLGGVY